MTGRDREGSPEFGPEHLPVTQDTKEQLIAELYGTLEKENHVLLRKDAYEISLYATGDNNVIISYEEDDDEDFVTYELGLTVFGSGPSSIILAEHAITPLDPDEYVESTAENERDKLERELAAEQFKRMVGLSARPATEAEVRLAVDLIRSANELGRSER